MCCRIVVIVYLSFEKKLVALTLDRIKEARIKNACLALGTPFQNSEAEERAAGEFHSLCFLLYCICTMHMNINFEP